MGGIEQLVEQAQQIGADVLPAAGDTTDGEHQPRAETAPGEPKAGSYEAFMASFGAPQRWAGR